MLVQLNKGVLLMKLNITSVFWQENVEFLAKDLVWE